MQVSGTQIGIFRFKENVSVGITKGSGKLLQVIVSAAVLAV
jgi:hypothetical protein